jgi:hypothetical protein
MRQIQAVDDPLGRPERLDQATAVIEARRRPAAVEPRTARRRTARRRPLLALGAIAAIVAPLAGGASLASASTNVTYYEFRAQHSDKCLEVYGFSQLNNGSVGQWDCWGGRNQQWRLVPAGSGYYELRPWHSDKCLEVSGISQANGAPIVQWDCWGGANQHWYFAAVGGGYYELRAQHSNKCLDVYGISKDNGAPLVQWDCWGGANQHWRFT